MNPEVNEEIKDLKNQIKELRGVLSYIIENIDNNTPLNSNSLIIRICKQELENK